MRSGVAGGVGLWDTRSVCACIKDFYLAASVSSVYFLCCWLCFMALGFISLPWFNEFITTGPHGVVLAMFPLIWIGVVCVIGAFSALVSSLLVVGAFSAAFRCVCIISLCHLDYLWTYCLFYWTRTSARQTHPLFRTGGSVNRLFPTFCHRN